MHCSSKPSIAAFFSEANKSITPCELPVFGSPTTVIHAIEKERWETVDSNVAARTFWTLISQIAEANDIYLIYVFGSLPSRAKHWLHENDCTSGRYHVVLFEEDWLRDKQFEPSEVLLFNGWLETSQYLID